MAGDEEIPVVKSGDDEDYATKDTASAGQENEGKAENAEYGVGGTSKDGGLSTADTVADGDAPAEEEDGDYKPF